jgi:hypothetical protein
MTTDNDADRDLRLRRIAINLLAHDMLLKDHANLRKDCEAYLLKRNETRPEMISAAMLTVCRVEAEATLYRIFGSNPPPPSETGSPKGVFLDLTNKPGEPLSWSESLEDIIGKEEEEEP